MARTPTTKRRRRAPGGYAPEETRQALVDSALALFGAQGYASTSVQEITTAAGVTKGAFYHHFESKEDLLRLIHEEFVDFQLAEMAKVIEENDSAVDQLYAMFQSFLRIAERYQASVAVAFQEQRYLAGNGFEQVLEKREQFDRTFLQVIERGVEQGVFRADLDARIVSLGLIGMCAWVHQWYHAGGRFTSEEIASIFARTVLDGLRAT